MTANPPAAMQLETVVGWLPDSRGWSTFRGITGRIWEGLHRRAVIDTRARNFSGWVTSPQQFHGLAHMAGGGQRPIVGRSGEALVNSVSNLNPTAMQAFYERMKRDGQ